LVKERDRLLEDTNRSQNTIIQLRDELIGAKLLAEELEEERLKIEREFRRFVLCKFGLIVG
jgi:hypothetical protein